MADCHDVLKIRRLYRLRHNRTGRIYRYRGTFGDTVVLLDIYQCVHRMHISELKHYDYLVPVLDKEGD